MEKWLFPLIGLAFGIVANLLTPVFQTMLDKLSTKRISYRESSLKKEYDLIKEFNECRDDYREYLIIVIIKTTFAGAFCGVLAGLIFFISSALMASHTNFHIHIFRFNMEIIDLEVLGQAVDVLFAVYIFQICKVALSITNKVNNYESYCNKIQNQFDKIKKVSPTL